VNVSFGLIGVPEAQMPPLIQSETANRSSLCGDQSVEAPQVEVEVEQARVVADVEGINCSIDCAVVVALTKVDPADVKPQARTQTELPTESNDHGSCVIHLFDGAGRTIQT
jgi:hypothetical protein